MNGTNAQIASSLVFVLRQYYELTDLPDTADDEAVYEWIKGRLAEVDRLRAGLQHIADDHKRNRWHPDTKFPEAGRNWHDGYVTLAAHHSLEAEKYLDPEGAAEGAEVWRLGSQGTDSEWWEKTGHCGSCGNVGSSCECDGQCGCAELHGPRLPDWKSLPEQLADARAEIEQLRSLLQPTLGGQL